MSQVVESLHLPAALQERVAHFAELEGISLEQWIVEAVASKLETTEFFHSRTRLASGKSLIELLDAVPRKPPIPGVKSK